MKIPRSSPDSIVNWAIIAVIFAVVIGGAFVISTPSSSSDTSPEPGTVEFNEAVTLAVINETNSERAARNLSPVDRQYVLEATASNHSDAMADSENLFEPSSPVACAGPLYGINTGATWYRLTLDDGGYYDTPDELARGLVDLWMGSPTHRDVILHPPWEVIGVGIAVSEQQGHTIVYATQLFCRG